MTVHHIAAAALVQKAKAYFEAYEFSSLEDQMSEFRFSAGVLVGFCLSGAISVDSYPDSYFELRDWFAAFVGIADANRLDPASLESWESVLGDWRKAQ